MQPLLVERGIAGEQFVQQHAQRIHVAAGVDVQLVPLGLLGAHVLDRADNLPQAGEHRLLGQLTSGGFGHTEINDLGYRAAVVQRDQDVTRLDVAVDDALLMRVLHGLADGDEQLQSLAGRQVLLVTELRDGDAVDQFHDEVRPARIRRPGVKHFCDVGMIHHRQCLFFGLEPRDHLPRVHTGLDDLQRNASLDRLVSARP